MFDARAVNRCGKRQSFFKMTVSYLHLTIGKTDGAGFVFPAARDLQNISVNSDLDIFGGNSGKFDLDQPAGRRFVNVRRRIPKSARRLGVFRRADNLKITID